MATWQHVHPCNVSKAVASAQAPLSCKLLHLWPGERSELRASYLRAFADIGTCSYV
jgi:hypothetical protein